MPVGRALAAHDVVAAEPDSEAAAMDWRYSFAGYAECCEGVVIGAGCWVFDFGLAHRQLHLEAPVPLDVRYVGSGLLDLASLGSHRAIDYAGDWQALHQGLDPYRLVSFANDLSRQPFQN